VAGTHEAGDRAELSLRLIQEANYGEVRNLACGVLSDFVAYCRYEVGCGSQLHQVLSVQEAALCDFSE
jgi:hypothetical protein